MTIEQGIKELLNASPAPLATGSRNYHLKAPERAVAPYIVFFQVAPDPLMTQSGAPSVLQREYQFSIFSGSQSQCTSVADALRSLINAARQTTWGTVQIKGVFFLRQFETYEDDTKLFHFALDFGIHFIPA